MRSPITISFRTEAYEDKYLDSLFRKLAKETENSKKTVGILYRTWKEKKTVETILTRADIKYEVIEKNNPWNLIKPGIKLVTMHSSKGLEFDTVIIPRLDKGVIPAKATDENGDMEDYMEVERSLLYVSMTRARNTLIMTTSFNASCFIKEKDPKLYQLNKL